MLRASHVNYALLQVVPMAPSTDVSSPTEELSTRELCGDDLRLFRDPLCASLEALCASEIFRNSPRSCDFIRHVVDRTLDGNADELKERLIGMSLLGRDASYDTSTDAGVRVRANDVRKRLNRYNETHSAELSFTIVLPTGTYVPRFFRVAAPAPIESTGSAELNAVESRAKEAAPMNLPEVPPPALTLFQLAIPTLVTLFLCIIGMRWQLSQEQYFTAFWQEILRGDQALLYLAPTQTEGTQSLVAIQEIREAAPLLDLAGQFHRRFTVMTTPGSAPIPGRMALHVGLAASGDLYSASFTQQPERYIVIDTPNGRMIVDRRNFSHPVAQHAALLTILNGPQPSIYIDGTDDSAIRSLVTRRCDESTFPGDLADSFHPGTMTQAVFPAESYESATIDRERLTDNIARLKYLP
jgi:hypothetical protein